MVVDARQTSLSVSEHVIVPHRSHTLTWVYGEWIKKEKTSSEEQFSEWKCHHLP